MLPSTQTSRSSQMSRALLFTLRYERSSILTKSAHTSQIP